MAPPYLIKKVLEDFIEIYRSHPCLWKVKSKEYKDRKKRAAAYKLLIQKLKEIEPDANKTTVAKKINNLRSNVRKEQKKYEKSLQSGPSADDVYCIKLWYYDLFNFLNDQDTPRESLSNLDSDEETSFKSLQMYQTQDSSADDQQQPNPSYDDQEHQNESYDNHEVPSSYKNLSRPPKPDKEIKKEESLAKEVLESERGHFKRPHSTMSEDLCDLIGKNVAMKLRALDRQQMLVADKLINDLLFEAEIGNLTPKHAYINMRDVLKQN